MGGGVGVDVVYAYASAADDAEFGGGFEELGVGLDGGADDEGVGVVKFGGEAVFDRVSCKKVPARPPLASACGGRAGTSARMTRSKTASDWEGYPSPG